MSTARVADVLAILESHAPRSWAEPWDRVGLLVGDADATVTGVLVSLDPTRDALDRAKEAGASVLLTHHPAFLEAPGLVPAPGTSGVAFEAARLGIALVAAHTNLDRSPEGAEALPEALGFGANEALESGLQSVDTVVTYVPPDAEEAVRTALAEAGAGRIGRYEACTFTSAGTGRFSSMAGAHPARGTRKGAPSLEEARVECVCDRGDGERIAAAVRMAHPYEEPLIVVAQASIDRGIARMGRVCECAPAMTLDELSRSVGRSLRVRPRVWGDPRRVVRRFGTAPGSGRSLVPYALRAGVDALVTGELRYHEALEAGEAGLAIVEAGHDATEWPMVPVLAGWAAETPGVDPSRVVTDEPRVGWWIAEGA